MVVLNTRIIQTHNAFRGSGDGVCLIELVHSTISIVCSSSKCIRSRGQEVHVNGGGHLNRYWPILVPWVEYSDCFLVEHSHCHHLIILH